MSKLQSLGAGAAVLSLLMGSTPAWAPKFGVDVPDVNVPKLNIPDVNVPKVKVPAVTPKVVVPKVNTPNVATKVPKTPAGVPLVPDASGKIPGYTTAPPLYMGNVKDVPKPKTGPAAGGPVNYGKLSNVTAPTGGPKVKFRPAKVLGEKVGASPSQILKAEKPKVTNNVGVPTPTAKPKIAPGNVAVIGKRPLPGAPKLPAKPKVAANPPMGKIPGPPKPAKLLPSNLADGAPLPAPLVKEGMKKATKIKIGVAIVSVGLVAAGIGTPFIVRAITEDEPSG